VGALYLFGSHARDEAQSGSDVDVFVEPAPGRDFGFLPFMEAYQAIQKAFGEAAEIGYSTRTGLSPYIVGDVGSSADFLMAASRSPRARLAPLSRPAAISAKI
jgi:predicted nucleotidyltransferase